MCLGPGQSHGLLSMKSHQFWRAIVAIAHSIRYLWLMLGVALLLLVVVELLFSGVEGSLNAIRSISHPAVHKTDADVYAKAPWAKQYLNDFRKARRNVWVPYVYFRRAPYEGTYVNVDSFGIRKTWRAEYPKDAAQPITVFMFGGSTM